MFTRLRTQVRDYVAILALPFAVLTGSTGLGFAISPWHHEGYAALIFVAGMTVIGATSGLFIAVICASTGALAFNYFIAEPAFEFNFNRPIDFIPPMVFLLCSVTSGLIAGNARDQAQAARVAKAQLDDLLEISRRFQSIDNTAEIRDSLTAEIKRQGPDCALHWRDDALLGRLAGNPDDSRRAAALRAALAAELPWLADQTVVFQAIGDGEALFGALTCRAPRAMAFPREVDRRDFVEGLGRLANLALTRVRLAETLAEQRARSRIDQLQSALLMSFSHDLRTPLTTISTAAASLRQFADAIAPADRADLLESIEDECARLNRLTENLMQLTRLESGSAALHFSAIAVDDMLRHCLRRNAPEAAGRNVVARLNAGTALVRADTALFELAVSNVLQNAIKFSPEGSMITMTSAIIDDRCVITISDQGIGVPARDQDRVFLRFVRGAQNQGGAQQGMPGGTGLGLAIARGFVEAAGGSIALASPGHDGNATTVTIALPHIVDEPVAGPVAGPVAWDVAQ